MCKLLSSITSSIVTDIASDNSLSIFQVNYAEKQMSSLQLFIDEIKELETAFEAHLAITDDDILGLVDALVHSSQWLYDIFHVSIIALFRHCIFFFALTFLFTFSFLFSIRKI
jgi:hypothetical protein